MHHITLLLLIPFVSSFIAFFIPNRKLVFFLSLLPLFLLLFFHSHWVGESINYPLAPEISISLYFSIDAPSLIFLYLTAIIIPISVVINESQNASLDVSYSLILLLQGLLYAFFTARDLVFFTFFWEGMLIPVYFLMVLSGGENSQKAAMKFLLYMIAGSILMIAAVILTALSAPEGLPHSFSIETLAKTAENSPHAIWLFAIFMLAFAVKTPLFPLHAWLPDAYYEASTAGTILLSALLSKAGIYGIVRVGIEIFPNLLMQWSPFLLTLAVFGTFYAGFAAWAERDFKRLVAYSSLAHVNFILAGLFSWNSVAHTGAILQAFNHGITITALFLVVDWLQKRIGSTSMDNISGLAKFTPHLCWLTLFFVLASIALPGTNTFIGELLILFGIFSLHPYVAAILTLTLVLSALYGLKLMQKIYFESPRLFQDSWIDLKPKEWLIATPLILLILWIGIYPAPILKQIQSFTVEKGLK